MKLLFAVKVHRLPVGSGEISFAAMHRAEMPMVSLGCMDRVMAANQILDFDGGNVLAAYLQDIFQAAGPLKVPPPNLTVLAKRNGGKFPDAHVSAVIRGGGRYAGTWFQRHAGMGAGIPQHKWWPAGRSATARSEPDQIYTVTAKVKHADVATPER